MAAFVPSPLDVDPPRGRRGLVAVAAAILTHVALVAGAEILASRGVGTARFGREKTVEMEVAFFAPPPPPPAPAPVAKPEAPVPVAPKVAPQAKTRNAPPPAAATAGKVVTRIDAPASEVVEFGEDTIVTGDRTFAGGFTASTGTATEAVYDARAHPDGVVGGTGTDPNADLSRPPRLAGGASWDDCPRPPEAEAAGIGEAVVRLRVELDAAGSVKKADVLHDPGHGFGREARRCALRRRWNPALDRAGRPVGATWTFDVRFLAPR